MASASLENVVINGQELPEVASLYGCVRAWMALDDRHKQRAELIVDRAFQFQDEGYTRVFRGAEISALAEHLPS